MLLQISCKNVIGFIPIRESKDVINRNKAQITLPTDMSLLGYHEPSVSPFTKVVMKESYDDTGGPNLGHRSHVKQTSFILKKDVEQRNRFRRFRHAMQNFFFSNHKKVVKTHNHQLNYDYEYNEIKVNCPSVDKDYSETKFILLLHPIGVGISKWYYDDLLTQLCEKSDMMARKYIFLVPDLLGCGSACNPIKLVGSEEEKIKKLPLLYPSDWAEQMIDFMSQYETTYKESHPRDHTSWAVTANGGCVSIALKIAERLVQQSHTTSKGRNPPSPLSNLILSAVPSLEAIVSSPNRLKIEKAYRRVSGVLGDIFWWYSLRKDGQFIQSFSEKNLAASPENLGRNWRPSCVETARIFGGKSRFATFSFLAGSLKGDCKDSLDALKSTDVKVDIIRGEDKRKNSAKSWFWEKQKKPETPTKDDPKVDGIDSIEIDSSNTNRTTLSRLLAKNGNSGNIINVGGRICLAQEDPEGFSNAIMNILE